ncbi:hypothetical protein Taro_043098, partial [Colocasia esculenta]|nr:hypothetical protein [Colocasia esculenta]
MQGKYEEEVLVQQIMVMEDIKEVLPWSFIKYRLTQAEFRYGRKPSEELTSDCGNGEIEIEKFSVNEVEIRRKDLMPVFDHHSLSLELGNRPDQAASSRVPYFWSGLTCSYSMVPSSSLNIACNSDVVQM